MITVTYEEIMESVNMNIKKLKAQNDAMMSAEEKFSQLNFISTEMISMIRESIGDDAARWVEQSSDMAKINMSKIIRCGWNYYGIWQDCLLVTSTGVAGTKFLILKSDGSVERHSKCTKKFLSKFTR